MADAASEMEQKGATTLALARQTLRPWEVRLANLRGLRGRVLRFVGRVQRQRDYRT